MRVAARDSIDSIVEFYSHALAIEREATMRYRALEAEFVERGEDLLAGLCRNLADLEQEHASKIEQVTGGLELPAARPGAHRWLEELPVGTGENPCEFDSDPARLLEGALHRECDAVGFYEWVANTTVSPEVRALAREMALEELDHVKWVRDAIDYLSRNAGSKADRA